jgi:hypothetical protein
VTTTHLIPPEIAQRYEVLEWHNACAVLKEGHPQEWKDILGLLDSFRLLRSAVVVGGGNRSRIAIGLDEYLYHLQWKKKRFDIRITVDQTEYPTPTHTVDCFKGRVALEVEWNNKDPFFDRDLNNFRLLFERHVIDVGVIITRASELQVVFDELGKGDSYGPSTTHMSRLRPRVVGGGGGGCPILAFGITRALYVED